MTSIRSSRELAAAVRGRRKDLHVSQAELAKGARVSRQSISALESGRTVPEFGLVLRVLEQLGLVLDVRTDRPVRAKRAIDLDEIIARHRRK